MSGEERQQAWKDPLGGGEGSMEINHMPREGLTGHMMYMGAGQPADPATAALQAVDALQRNLDYYRVQEDALFRQFPNTRRHMMAPEQQAEAMLMQQKRQELYEQREQHEQFKQQKIEGLKNKKKSEESAVASNEVKLKLRECLLNKSKNPPTDYRHWSKQHSSLEQHSPPTSGLSPPLRGHLLAKYDDEYPLRKTVSEPNLKMRSKLLQRQLQRSSPLVQRRDILKKKRPLTIDTTLSNSNPDSGPNSPPSGTSQGSQGSVGETPPLPKEEQQIGGKMFPLEMMSKMVLNQNNQSMPNISIGQPRDQPAAVAAAAVAALTEAEVRARLAAHHGMPLTQHMLTGPLPYYPPPPHSVLEAGMPAGADASYIDAQKKALEYARSAGQLPQMSPVAIPSPGAPYSIGSMNPMALCEAAQLKRTQSAPLPLPGQIYLQQQMLIQEQMMKENQKHFLKQRLASSIIARSGSKNHMENVDEEVEARLVQEMQGEMMMDLKPRRSKEKEAFLLKMRQRALQGESPPASATGTPVGLPPSGGATKMLVHAHSSPAQFSLPSSLDEEDGNADATTGLVYDTAMLQHGCVCKSEAVHPEHPGRLRAIYDRLHETGLVSCCQRVASRKASLEELQSCHSEAYSLLYGSNPKKLADPKLDPNIFEPLIQRFCKLPCGGIGVDLDTAWNESQTPNAARIAAGCVIDLAIKVATDQLKNGFAIVRPPGHHAEPTRAMGFCFFNSIAVASKQLLNKLKLQKILIVDWDVHHGNSTQQIFYADPRVLYISMHRHDNGNFFPGTGAPEECGIDRGIGHNVNIAWSGGLNPPMGDAEYLAAFRTVVMPIAHKFQPEIVLVSAGFDAATGHPAPLGGYTVSTECFGYMAQRMQTLAGGKVVLVLEGGYELRPISDCAEICLRTLLQQKIPLMKDDELCRPPCSAAIETLRQTIDIQARYWPCLRNFTGSLHLSAIDAQRGEEADTVSAFASLSVVPEKPSDDDDLRSEPMEQS